MATPAFTFCNEEIVSRTQDGRLRIRIGLIDASVDGGELKHQSNTRVQNALHLDCSDWSKTGLKPFAISATPPRSFAGRKPLADVRVLTLVASRDVIVRGESADVLENRRPLSHPELHKVAVFGLRTFRLRVIRVQRIEDVPQDTGFNADVAEWDGRPRRGAGLAPILHDLPDKVGRFATLLEQNRLDGYVFSFAERVVWRNRIRGDPIVDGTTGRPIIHGTTGRAFELVVDYGAGLRPVHVSTDVVVHKHRRFLGTILVVEDLSRIQVNVSDLERTNRILAANSILLATAPKPANRGAWSSFPPMGLPLLTKDGHVDTRQISATVWRLMNLSGDSRKNRSLSTVLADPAKPENIAVFPAEHEPGTPVQRLRAQFDRTSNADVYERLLVDIGLGILPGIGDVLDLAELITMIRTRKDRWGDPVTEIDIALQAILTLLPATPAALRGLRTASALGAGRPAKTIANVAQSDPRVATAVQMAAGSNSSLMSDVTSLDDALGPSAIPRVVSVMRDLLRDLQ